ncbi:hypothetical protein CDD80_2288 [Ophiocordyceps camponoti-rufipedis]|uniref:Prefoldin subunit 5 n=1 Tax=Ophiocordyceps camponoti-rufipedis TaxID=2004952 RepID=A0A2C5ZED1_9HYPO|nr:hypothetical protein CDD80_2288 [Ophiocordyceps camponoti-rufipedis]
MAAERDTVDLTTLEPAQLAQVKKQLDEELEHLTSSYAQLHGAQSKFRECLICVRSRADASNSVLVPLTNSLYVRGELTNAESCLVDVGTGFLVEKKLKSAEKFYERKTQELSKSLQGLESIVQRKQTNVKAVEDVLRQKLMSSKASTAAAQ